MQSLVWVRSNHHGHYAGRIGRCPNGKREFDTGLFRIVADGIDSAIPRLKLTRPVGPDMMLNPGNEHTRYGVLLGPGDVAERLKAAVC
jgi:hypothetical protein